jgi:hypothetical protein
MKGIEKVVLQASMSLPIDGIVLWKKIVALYASVFVEDWIKST